MIWMNERMASRGSPRKTMIQRFESSKFYRRLNDKGIFLDDSLRLKIIDFYDHFDDRDKNYTWMHRISIWIEYKVDDWIERRNKMELMRKYSVNLEWFCLAYGEENGVIMYEDYAKKKRELLPTSDKYWSNKGISEDKIPDKIIEHQKKASSMSPVTNDPRYYTIRCKEYWMKKGYSESDAVEQVSTAQTRDLSYFINKYGHDKGIIKCNTISNKKKASWAKKSNDEMIEHAIKTTPNVYNENGLESKVLSSFISTNNINPQFCKFGKPSNQFFQYIDGIGFRRYDLAVFDEITHQTLLMIIEFHGYGHINFSDYNESMQNERFKVNGKELASLNITYGDAYYNDYYKREHILSTFPDASYIVIWPEDYKNNRMTINELLHKR